MRKVHKVEDLEFEYPDCTVCPNGGNTRYESDGWLCESCGTTWNRAGGSGYADCEECEEETRTYTLVDGKRMCLGCAVNGPAMLRRFQNLAEGGTVWIETAPGSNLYCPQSWGPDARALCAETDDGKRREDFESVADLPSVPADMSEVAR